MFAVGVLMLAGLAGSAVLALLALRLVRDARSLAGAVARSAEGLAAVAEGRSPVATGEPFDTTATRRRAGP